MILFFNFNSEITELYNTISDKILSMDITSLKNGIWNIISNINTNNFFKNEGFKCNYPISQLFGPLKVNNIFSFKIKR